MALFGASALVFGFVLLFGLFRIAEKSKEVIQISRDAFTDLRDPELDDDAKEVAIQRHAKRLVVLFFLVVTGAFGAVLIPLALVWLLARLNVLKFEAVLETTFSWPFLLVSTIAVIGICCWSLRRTS